MSKSAVRSSASVRASALERSDRVASSRCCSFTCPSSEIFAIDEINAIAKQTAATRYAGHTAACFTPLSSQMRIEALAARASYPGAMHPGLVFAAALATSPPLLPRPQSVEGAGCAASSVPHEVAGSFDGGARTEIDDRWSALGIGRLRSGNAATIVVRKDATLSPQAYRLTVAGGRATIESADAAGAFYGAVTLAQLPQRSNGTWTLPCVRIADKPALPWRILSDDVSRGPLPTMRYFEERIRTIAAFKMNGYSPYMEHVFLSPTDPLPAPLDGVTAAQLQELTEYAARFHVALIPEQQSFAHMHNTLRIERYAGAAEFPHGFLLAPNAPLSMEYLSRVVAQELAAVARPPFFHIGSDETATLGLGSTQSYVAQRGRSNVYAEHIAEMNRLIAPSGARLMLWDDGIENDPAI